MCVAKEEVEESFVLLTRSMQPTEFIVENKRTKTVFRGTTGEDTGGIVLFGEDYWHYY